MDDKAEAECPSTLMFCSVVKVETTDEETCDDTDLQFGHFLDFNNQHEQIQNNADHGYDSNGIKVLNHDACQDNSNNWPYPCVLGNCIKYEPGSSEENANGDIGNYVDHDSDNSKDLDWNVDHDSDNSKDLDWNVEQELQKRKINCKLTVGKNASKKKSTYIKKKTKSSLGLKLQKSKKVLTQSRRVYETEDRVQSAFKDIAAKLYFQSMGGKKEENVENVQDEECKTDEGIIANCSKEPEEISKQEKTKIKMSVAKNIRTQNMKSEDFSDMHEEIVGENEHKLDELFSQSTLSISAETETPDSHFGRTIKTETPDSHFGRTIKTETPDSHFGRTIKTFMSKSSGSTSVLMSMNSMPIVNTTAIELPSVSLEQPSTSISSKIRCIFCSEVFTAVRFKKHIETYFHTFRCSVCFVSFCQRESCARHINGAHQGENARLTLGNFLIPVRQQKNAKEQNSDRYWFKCTECESLVKTEYLLINHYKRVHKKLYDDLIQLEFKCHASERSYLARTNGMSSWSSKFKIKKCFIRLTRIEGYKEVDELRKVQLATTFLNIFSDVVQVDCPSERMVQKQTISNLTCEVCSKTYVKTQAYKLHMRRAHNIKTTNVNIIADSMMQEFNDVGNLNSPVIPFVPSPGDSSAQNLYNGVSEEPAMFLPCLICQAKFTSSHNLIEHYRSHTYTQQEEYNATIRSIGRNQNTTERSDQDDTVPNDDNLEYGDNPDIFPIMLVKAEHLYPSEDTTIT